MTPFFQPLLLGGCPLQKWPSCWTTSGGPSPPQPPFQSDGCSPHNQGFSAYSGVKGSIPPMLTHIHQPQLEKIGGDLFRPKSGLIPHETSQKASPSPPVKISWLICLGSTCSTRDPKEKKGSGEIPNPKLSICWGKRVLM